MIKLIYNLLQKIWIRALITIALVILVLLTYNPDSSDFSMDDFKPPLTIEKLCKAIVDDNYNISIQTLINTINWLNELLKVPNFYDILHVKKLNINFPKNITDLVDKTKDYRNKNFSDLNKDKQNTIKRLNHLLLEETYPQEILNSNDSKNIAFVKAWICVGNLVTLFISGFIVCYIITEAFKKFASSLAIFIEWVLSLGLCVLMVFAYFKMSSVTHDRLNYLEFSPIVIVLIILLFDLYFLKKNNQEYFPRLHQSRAFVLNFDFGIFGSLALTYTVSLTMKNTFGNEFTQGFISGATAFQLIIANLIFDPCLYKFETAK